MSLDGAGVERVVSALLAVVPDAEFRLVGTASSALRGIEMPVADIDVLFRDRADVDAWCGALGRHYDVSSAPDWMNDASQYFAIVDVDGTRVELSTVEVPSDADTMECFGSGPWTHFDWVPCGHKSVPAVASELRLLTEVARGRDDRWQSLVRFLAVRTFDLRLIERGLVDHRVPADVAMQVLGRLSTATDR